MHIAPGRTDGSRDHAAEDYGRSGIARGSIGRTVSDHGAGQIDMHGLRAYRLGRLRQELRRYGVPAILLADPINIRYATGMRNMQPWSMHSNLRMALVPAEGGAILFEYHGSEHLAATLETVAEVRPARAKSWPSPATGRAARAGRRLAPRSSSGRPRSSRPCGRSPARSCDWRSTGMWITSPPWRCARPGWTCCPVMR